MKNINKSETEPLEPQHHRKMKLSKGCHNRQPFSFANISIYIIYNKTLRQNQISLPTIKPPCFTNQTEIPEKALIKPIKPTPKTYSYQPIENSGIILYRLLVSFYIGVKTHLSPFAWAGQRNKSKNTSVSFIIDQLDSRTELVLRILPVGPWTCEPEKPVPILRAKKQIFAIHQIKVFLSPQEKVISALKCLLILISKYKL
ncbi:MAG: hypothetical protein WC599_00800 [Bacteroidales bacterium]